MYIYNVKYMYIHVHCVHTLYMYIYTVHVYVQSCTGVHVVCLTLLASFFLPSHLSFKNMCMYMYVCNICYIHVSTQCTCTLH